MKERNEDLAKEFQVTPQSLLTFSAAFCKLLSASRWYSVSNQEIAKRATAKTKIILYTTPNLKAHLNMLLIIITYKVSFNWDIMKYQKSKILIPYFEIEGKKNLNFSNLKVDDWDILGFNKIVFWFPDFFFLSYLKNHKYTVKINDLTKTNELDRNQTPNKKRQNHLPDIPFVKHSSSASTECVLGPRVQITFVRDGRNPCTRI